MTTCARTVLLGATSLALALAAVTPAAAGATAGERAGALLTAPAAVGDPEVMEPGPVPGLATETSTTVRNADGSYTASIAAAPINYLDDDGEWVPISNELVEAAGPTYAVENEANDYTVSIPEDPSATPVRFAMDDDWVTMKLIGSVDAEPDVDGTEASFDGLAPGADTVTFQATNAGLKETITLEAPPTSPVRYRYAIRTSPSIAAVTQTAGRIEYTDHDGEVAFAMPAPNMLDSATPEPTYSEAVTYSLAASGAGWTLTVTPDPSWLTDPSRVYPVLIDPSIDKGDQKDCWIQADMPNASRCQNDYVYAGLADGSLRRSFLDFGVDSIEAGATINDANLFLFLEQSWTRGSDGATDYALYQPRDRWAAGVSWNGNGIGTVGWNGGSTDARLSPTLPSLSGGTASQWVQWNVRNTVNSWRSGSVDNRGFLLRSDNEGRSKQVRFVSGTNLNYPQWRPVLRIDYTAATHPPSAPSALRATPGTARSAYNRVPTLSALVSDPEGATMGVRFNLFRNGVSIWTGSVVASSGTRASIQVPAGLLVNRKLFRWSVKAFDGTSSGSPLVRSDLFVAATGDDDSSFDYQGSTGQEDDWTDTSGVQSPFSSKVAVYAYSPSGTEASLAPQTARTKDWDNICSGDGVENEDRYDHVEEYYRYDARPEMVGRIGILYCGMTEDWYPESLFGLRHIREKHKSGYAWYGSWNGSDWQTFMDFAVGETLDSPNRVTVYDNENRHCYERKLYFGSPNGSRVYFMHVVILGKTGRRIMSSWMRESDRSYCMGHGQVIYNEL